MNPSFLRIHVHSELMIYPFTRMAENKRRLSRSGGDIEGAPIDGQIVLQTELTTD